ncbi:hypothetical protein JL721_11773 [Aureococcus anophagefferens]|nr:hypothetical protein JL721_11773 [Aureococcus anophagefferens]
MRALAVLALLSRAYASDAACGSVSFSERIITTLVNGANSVFAVDVDVDGDVDVLASSANDNFVAWYENDGAEGFSRRVITWASDRSAFAVDLDGDGDVDALAGHWQYEVARAWSVGAF